MRRSRSSLGACLVALIGSCVAVVAAPVAVPAAQAATSIVIQGRGNGHGIGMSQYGAYGYAVDHGWNYQQILAHYYGGTYLGTTADTSISVRLLALDNAQTAVVHPQGSLLLQGYEASGTWRSMVARETTQRVYEVWGRTDTAICPTSSAELSPATGWTLVATVANPNQQNRVTFRTATDTTFSTDPANELLAVCEPGGRVRSYRGTISATNGTDNENRTVNDVDHQQYLRSVVAAEVPASWGNTAAGMHSLRAQAIAARSYSLAESRYSYAKTCDTQACQVYNGAGWRSSVGGSFNASENANTTAAVNETNTQVLRFNANNAVVLAMFSSSSGGHTAPSTLNFTPVADVGDGVASNPHRTWTVTLTAAQLQSAYPSIGSFVDIQVLTRDGFGEWGGRALSVKVIGTSGSVTTTGNAMRSTFGWKSNFINPVSSPTQPPPAPVCGDRVPPPVVGTSDPAVGARFTPTDPIRLIDTREGLGTARAPLPAQCTIVVDPGVADHATAVAVNLTSVNPNGQGFLTAWPCGEERPFVSAIQTLPGQIVPGSAIVPLGADGTFCVYSHVATELVVDLFGTYSPATGDKFEPINPVRRYDSRGGAMRPAGSVLRLQVGGTNAAPSGATGAALTVHAVDSTGPAFVTVYPCTEPRPWVSSLNAASGSSVTNHVDVRLNAAGEVCVFVTTRMHLIVDVSGWFGPTASTEFFAISPVRLADTRENHGFVGASPAGVNRPIQLAGVAGLPPAANVKALAAEVTAVNPGSSGYVTVHPCQSPIPGVSMLRYARAANAAALVTGILDGSGRWCVQTSSTLHVIIDVSGYWA